MIDEKENRLLEDAQYSLHCIMDDIEAVLNKDLHKRLVAARNKIIKVIRPYMDKEDALRDRMSLESEKIASYGGVYSINHELSDRIVDVPEGALVTFVTSGRECRGKRYESPTWNSPSYADAFKSFCKSIPITGDEHHVFLEGFRVHTLVNRYELEFVTGS